jgi:hypothetical protein
MDGKTGGNRSLRRAGALVVAGAVAVLAAACGSSAPSVSSSSGGSYTYVQLLALAQCMRSHGVPDFPDPTASGGYSLTSNGSIQGADGSVDLGDSQVQAAYGQCRHLLPDGPSFSQLQQTMQQEQQAEAKALPELVKFSECMRGHGVPDYPDPTLAGLGGSGNLKGSGINPGSPQFQAAVSACQHVLPAGAHISVHASEGTHAG